jgi:hypothetical protein
MADAISGPEMASIRGSVLVFQGVGESHYKMLAGKKNERISISAVFALAFFSRATRPRIAQRNFSGSAGLSISRQGSAIPRIGGMSLYSPRMSPYNESWSFDGYYFILDHWHFSCVIDFRPIIKPDRGCASPCNASRSCF